MRQCLGLFEAEKNRLMVFMIIFFSKIDAYVLTKTGNCSDVTQVSRARSLSLPLSFSPSLPPSPPPSTSTSPSFLFLYGFWNFSISCRGVHKYSRSGMLTDSSRNWLVDGHQGSSSLQNSFSLTSAPFSSTIRSGAPSFLEGSVGWAIFELVPDWGHSAALYHRQSGISTELHFTVTAFYVWRPRHKPRRHHYLVFLVWA